MTSETVAVRNGKTLQCPKCKVQLRVALKDGIEIDTCEKCQGVWADFADEKTLLEIKTEVFTIDELRRLRRQYAPSFTRQEIQYFPCPVCQKLMHRRNWGSHSGVVVDRCEDHGTWHDAGEIEKIRDFIRIGGIEYEKLKLTENGLTGLEGKMEQEILRLDKRVDSAYRRARFFSLIGF